MSHRPSAACLVVASALVAPLLAQSRPSFSGNWLLVVDKSTPPILERHGRQITIAQDSQTITLTQIGFKVSGTFTPGSGAAASSMPAREEFQYSLTYNCDGAEHPTPRVAPPNQEATPLPPNATTMSVRPGDSSYRAIWTRDQLVIMTRETTILTGPSGEPRSVGAASRKALSLDADGMLVVDTIRISDPTPNGATQAAPVPVRSVYRKVPQTQDGLDPRIPAPIAAKYRDIRDAKDWLNPKVIMRAEGVEVLSPGLPSGRKTVPVAELRALIIGLPVADWPYGRVVLASDISLRRGDRSEDELIKQNHDAADRTLKALGITVDWWPS